MRWASELSIAQLAEGGLFSDGDWVESKDQDPTGSIRLTQLADVGVGEFRNRSDRWMSPDQADALRCTYLEPGDVLIARMPDPIGRACLVPSSLGKAVTVVDVAVLRVRRADVDPRYVMWAINSPAFHLSVVALQSGTTRKRISRKNLATLSVPVPSLAEQRRIVDLLEDHLSRLDAASEGLLNARRRIESLERSALDGNFAGGELVPLAELIDDISAGRSFGSSNAPSKEGEWGIIKVSAMTWGEFNADENKAVAGDRVDPRFEIREGDLLVSRANTADYVGASVLVGPVRTKLLLSDKSLRITPKHGVHREWLWRALQAPSARRQITALATGTKVSMRNISQAALRQILLPKVGESMQFDALNAFAVVAVSSNRLRAQISTSEARLANLRRALLSAAFAGRLTRTSPEVPESSDMVGA